MVSFPRTISAVCIEAFEGGRCRKCRVIWENSLRSTQFLMSILLKAKERLRVFRNYKMMPRTAVSDRQSTTTRQTFLVVVIVMHAQAVITM